MKKCPQCNSVFADENKFCLNDGTILIEENLSLPSSVEIGEEPTIIRNAPIVVDIAPQNPPSFQTPAVQETIILHAPPKQTSKTPKYAVFLILGLIIGGGLVLGAFLLAGKFYQNRNSDVDVALKNVDSSARKTVENVEEPKTDVSADGFNGRVIAINANLRSEPNLYSDEIAVLPLDERINIIRRENDGSPWYYVESESGESGWIHGNTIEITK